MICYNTEKLKPTSFYQVAACFLHSNYVLALVVPAALVLLLNLGVTITAVYIAHRYDNSMYEKYVLGRAIQIGLKHNMDDCTFQGWRPSGHKLKRSGVGDPAEHPPSLSPPWTHLAPCPPRCLSPCPVDQHHPQLQPGILHSSVQRPCQQGNQRPGKVLYFLFQIFSLCYQSKSR